MVHTPAAQLARRWAASGLSDTTGMGVLGASRGSTPPPPAFSQVQIGSSHREAQPISSPCRGCSANKVQQDGRHGPGCRPAGLGGGGPHTVSRAPRRTGCKDFLCEETPVPGLGCCWRAGPSPDGLRPAQPPGVGRHRVGTYCRFPGSDWELGRRASQGVPGHPGHLFRTRCCAHVHVTVTRPPRNGCVLGLELVLRPGWPLRLELVRCTRPHGITGDGVGIL